MYARFCRAGIAHTMAVIPLLIMSLVSQAFGDQVLASYEPSEASALSVLAGPSDPGLSVTWPVQGGVDGAPSATEGTHVLKMAWTGEADRKVEIRHNWAGSTFDLPGLLGGIVEIQVDVYVTTPSALPQIVGIWDDVFGWVKGCPVPAATNEWVTVSMYVGHLQSFGLNHIAAVLFEKLAGDDGVVYIDNLRLISARHVSFAGYDWVIKSGSCIGPGPNDFSRSEDNIWVDPSGRLHLKIRQEGGRWLCSEIVAHNSLGYGTYAFTVESPITSLDINEILGFFTWDENAPAHNYRELDFEFGRWGDVNADNAQYVVQPWDTCGNTHRFNIDYAGTAQTTTHVMTWGPDAILFESYYGAWTSVPAAGDMIQSWHYLEGDNPPPGAENVRLNLWLRWGLPPSNGQGVEVVISDFRFSSALPADMDSDGVVDILDSCPNTISGSPVASDGCPPVFLGDYNRDGDVDCPDVNAFLQCASGPAIPYAGDCSTRDFDTDHDVDVDDFGAFQRCFSGESVLAGCEG